MKMKATESWQRAEVPGPTKANTITKPEIILAMVKRAKRPILIVGHQAIDGELKEEKPIDYLIKIAEKSEIPVVATAHMIDEFLKRGYKPESWMPVVDIGNRLVDPEWKGLRGEGQHDLVLITGIPYYMEWLILSALKHFAPQLKSISLDRFYQPHATWSFPNLSIEDWQKSLIAITEKIGGN
jgi:acetyl-CoA decarbonylase/synthase complex subunit epsilon